MLSRIITNCCWQNTTSICTWIWCTERFGSMLFSKNSLTVNLAENCSSLWILSIFCLIFWVPSLRAKTCFSFQLLLSCYECCLDAQVMIFGWSCHFSGMCIEKEGCERSHDELSLAFPRWGDALQDALSGAWICCWKQNCKKFRLCRCLESFMDYTDHRNYTLYKFCLTQKPDVVVQQMLILEGAGCAWGSIVSALPLPPSCRFLLCSPLTCWFLAKRSDLLTTKRLLVSAVMAWYINDF